jgi:hypothetical protein
MTFKKIVSAFLVLCMTAILAVAVCGCDDLGDYEDAEEYYNSFGDIILISRASKDGEEYSVEDYFYNEESRENFLAGDDGAYQGVEHSDYVYMAIPFECDIDMDSIGLFLQSQSDVPVYINVFVTDKVPSAWRPIPGNQANENVGGSSETESEEETEEEEYDDPDPLTRVGEIAIYLEKGQWGSFVLDIFSVNGAAQNSIQVKEDQYLLLQIRNNSGVRIFDTEKNAYVDPQTGLELQRAEITMTNLLIRALSVDHGNEAQGGE